MSTTEIYGFKANGYAEFIGETQNAFRGAFVIWESFEKNHLDPLPPMANGKSYSRTVTGEGLDDLWKLPYTDKISREEKIVLLSTFDKNVVRSSELAELINAYRAFDKNFEFETYCSLPEQAQILEKHKEQYVAFGFNQTSVNSAFWTEDRNTCECENCDGCQEDYYNINTESEHFYIFDELDKEDGRER